ncbi:MAG: hypothetical protein Q4F55_04340 [Bacillota bacterium]|nr:hypothetical protein [Bacillota bacterium]
MKQFIVLVASIMLGLVLVSNLLLDDNSILSSMKDLWRSETEIRNMQVIR